MLKIGVATVAAVLGAAAIAYASNREQAHEWWKRTTADPGQLCFDYERQSLKDPFSAKLASYTVDKDSTVTIKYYAKNSYGAYGPGEAICYVSGDAVHPGLTTSKREIKAMEAYNEKLERQSECLQAEIKDMYEGKSAKEANRNCGRLP